MELVVILVWIQCCGVDCSSLVFRGNDSIRSIGDAMDMDRILGQADNLRQELRQIGSQILATSEKLTASRRAPAEAAEAVKRVKGDIDDREVLIGAEVVSELTDEVMPKPKYSNADTRKAETRKRVAVDPELRQLQAKLQALESKRLDADIQESGLKDQLSALDYVRSLKVAEAELLTVALRAGPAFAPEVIIEEAVQRAVETLREEHQKLRDAIRA